MDRHSGSHCTPGLCLDTDVRKDVGSRLLSLKGHVDGIIRMLDDETIYCVDILRQLKAIQGALTKVGEQVFFSHVKDHVVTAAQRGDTDKIMTELKEILKYR